MPQDFTTYTYIHNTYIHTCSYVYLIAMRMLLGECLVYHTDCKYWIFVGGSCRARVILELAKRFESPKEALCGLTSPSIVENVAPPSVHQPSMYSPIPIQHVTPSPASSVCITEVDPLMESFRSLSPDDQKSFVTEALSLVASQQFNVDLPQHFIELSMKKLAAGEV